VGGGLWLFFPQQPLQQAQLQPHLLAQSDELIQLFLRQADIDNLVFDLRLAIILQRQQGGQPAG